MADGGHLEKMQPGKLVSVIFYEPVGWIALQFDEASGSLGISDDLIRFLK